MVVHDITGVRNNMLRCRRSHKRMKCTLNICASCRASVHSQVKQYAEEATL